MVENNILIDDLQNCHEVDILLNASPWENQERLVEKFPPVVSAVEAKQVSVSNTQEHFLNFRGKTPQINDLKEYNLNPYELLNIGPSEKLKKLRKPNLLKEHSLLASLPEEILNIGPSQKLKDLLGPSSQSKCISKSSLPAKLQYLEPSEKLKRLCASKETNSLLGNCLPNKLSNIGPSEKLRKLTAPTLIKRKLLKSYLCNKQNYSANHVQKKDAQGASEKPKNNLEKLHQIFQKRLQAVMRKPNAIIKKIEPERFKQNQFTKSSPSPQIQPIALNEVHNKGCKEKKKPTSLLKKQVLSINNGKQIILDLKGKPKLSVKRHGDKTVKPNNISKFYKVPLDTYNNIVHAFDDSNHLDKNKIVHMLKQLEECQTVQKQNDEIVEINLVSNKEPDSQSGFIKEQRLLKSKDTSLSSNSNCDDSVNYCGSSDDAPKVKLNSKRTVVVCRPQNNHLRNKVHEIHDFNRRKISKKTYKRHIKERLLFGLKNKVDLKNSITHSAVLPPNKNHIEPLEPINLEAGEWYKLYTPINNGMPVDSLIAPKILKLRERLPTLTGRDKLEVIFLLSVMSSFPNMSKEIKELMYQRLNLVYIAILFNWETAITLAQESEKMSNKINTTSKNITNIPILQSKTNSFVTNWERLNEESSTNLLAACNLSKDDSTKVPPKSQYHFEIIIKDKAPATNT